MKTLHQIWLQYGEPPDPLSGYARHVEDLCKEHAWRWTLWSASDVGQLSLASQEIFRRLSPKCCHVSQQSNVLRYLLLRDFGGLYLDADIDLRVLPDVAGVWMAATKNARTGVGSFALACPAGDPWIESVVAQLDAVDLSQHGSAGGALMAANRTGANVWPLDDWYDRPGFAARLGSHACSGYRRGHFLTAPVIH